MKFDFNEIKCFRSELYFDQNYFDDLGVQLIDSFSWGSYHYYALGLNVDKMDGTARFKFSSLFASKKEVLLITKEEFESAKRE